MCVVCGWLFRYCDCYKAGIACGPHCKCNNCLNGKTTGIPLPGSREKPEKPVKPYKVKIVDSTRPGPTRRPAPAAAAAHPLAAGVVVGGLAGPAAAAAVAERLAGVQARIRELEMQLAV